MSLKKPQALVKAGGGEVRRNAFMVYFLGTEGGGVGQLEAQLCLTFLSLSLSCRARQVG